VVPRLEPRVGATEWRQELLDPLADGRWASFVGTVPEATVFHHPAWLAMLSRAYGYPLAACCITGRDGGIRAGAPLALVRSRLTGRRLVCVPFSDHCLPLIARGDGCAGEALVGALEQLRRRLGVPLRVHGPLPAGARACVFARFHGHELVLEPDFDEVVRRFHRRSALLRGVRRAMREGLNVERHRDPDALRAFYRLNLVTRRRLGMPVQPRRFIADLARLFDAGLGFVALVRDGGRPIAAAVFLTFHGRLVYKYGASDPSSLHKRPNNLLFHEVIRWGCEEGLGRLDFGRTDFGHESLRDFKRAWGAEERLLEYHALADPCPKGEDALARRAAPLLRRSPLVVNRAVGELLYRHVG
jgi:CelD/BcsL family acetyltransferase involved in cellulose biosynthesis